MFRVAFNYSNWASFVVGEGEGTCITARRRRDCTELSFSVKPDVWEARLSCTCISAGSTFCPATPFAL